MPLPGSGSISISQISVELGRASTATTSLGESAARSLAGVASGAISMSNFYGKSAQFTFTKTISSSVQNYNLLNDMVANGYVNGSAFTANITINPGVYIWSDSTSLAAFNAEGITGTGTITITNNGFIMGKGGRGGHITNSGATSENGQNGGNAISTSKPLTINNQAGYIGGGGGGSASASHGGAPYAPGAGGAGGGNGGDTFIIDGAGNTTYRAGQVGGAIGQNGLAGSPEGYLGLYVVTGSGGRIMPGTTSTGPYLPQAGYNSGSAVGGASQAGSAGSAVRSYDGKLSLFSYTCIGGGGGYGAAGGNSLIISATVGAFNVYGGSGGGSGDAGGDASPLGSYVNAPGTGGKAINTNGNSITWVGGTASSSRSFGAVS